MDKPLHWRWACYGAVIGVVIILADLLLEWRETTYQPWTSTGEIAFNLGQTITILLLTVVVGFIAGAMRSKR